jgi:hypothetical protein
MLTNVKTNAPVLNAIAQSAVAASAEGGQAPLDTLNGLRAALPVFPFQVAPGGRGRVSNLKSVPPEFMEQSNTAMKTETVLERGGVDPDQLRDLLRYATAYAAAADAAEMLAKELRESVDSAIAKVGAESLTTYKVVGRLAKRSETARLLPLFHLMRRTLGRGPKARKTDEPVPAPETTQKAA